MTTGHRGIFVTLNGLGGAGKSTTTEHLCRYLTDQDYTVHATTEPSHGRLGEIARYGTDTYSGHALACLVAADRYHHLDTEIRPNLEAGADRRLRSLRRLFLRAATHERRAGRVIEAINAAADVPDLAVVLTADPTVTAHRIGQRGAHNRFEAGITTSRTEADLYRDTTARLAERGYPLLTVDTTDTTPAQVVAAIGGRIAHLAGVPQTDTTTA